jgi:hypothetical protein
MAAERSPVNEVMTGKMNAVKERLGGDRPSPPDCDGGRETAQTMLSRHIAILKAKAASMEALLALIGETSGPGTPEEALWELLVSRSNRGPW